ncbi:hypothetical protein HD554DRAFT_2168565 [Boletus coccyginus]|nr:hypothetical protein HD554DRAFT_2168565 [Boletus coccyginus]
MSDSVGLSRSHSVDSTRPLSAEVRHAYYYKGTGLSQASYWGFGLFLTAADLVMILRVYAMCNQSKKILSILLFVYASQTIITFVWDGIYTNPDDISVLSSLKKKTNPWGDFPYTGNLLFNIHELTQPGAPTVEWMIYLDILSYALLCAIMPRFVIGIRESHARDLRNRWQGIDTGFGVISQPNSSQNAATPAIALGDGVVGPEVARAEESEAIQLEVVRSVAC